MSGPTCVLSSAICSEFCNLCDRAHEFWLNHLALFDNNPRSEEFMSSAAGPEWFRLHTMSHEYSLLLIRKLHDSANINGNTTLGIDYVLTYGIWPGSVLPRLEGLAKELGFFADKLRGVRNKILSHNDLATIVAGDTLGDFATGADVKYFKALQQFVDVVHGEVIGGPFPFSTLVENDVAFFLHAIKPSPLRVTRS